VQANISIRISPEFGADKAASGLEVLVPMPREVQRVNCDSLKPSQASGLPPTARAVSFEQGSPSGALLSLRSCCSLHAHQPKGYLRRQPSCWEGALMEQKAANQIINELGAAAQVLGPVSWDWQERAHKLVWKFKRVQGGTDHTLKVCKNPAACAGLIQHCTPMQWSVRLCHEIFFT
jgi:hypothetical protein